MPSKPWRRLASSRSGRCGLAPSRAPSDQSRNLRPTPSTATTVARREVDDEDRLDVAGWLAHVVQQGAGVLRDRVEAQHIRSGGRDRSSRDQPKKPSTDCMSPRVLSCTGEDT